MTWSTRYKASAILALTLIAILTIGAGSAALQPPGLPYTPWGYVRFDGALVGSGHAVTAWIDGVQYASTTTTSGSLYTFDILADDPDTPAKDGGVPGDVVRFRVDGALAPQTGIWQPAASQVDLSLSSATATPTSTPCTQRIYGYVFNDINGNGFRDTGETTGPSGVMVRAVLQPGGSESSAQTMANGWYQVYNLASGTYDVSADLAGYTATSPITVKTTLNACSWNEVYFGVQDAATTTATATSTSTATATVTVTATSAIPTATATNVIPSATATVTDVAATATPTSTDTPTGEDPTPTQTATPTPMRLFLGLILKGVAN